MDAYDDDDEWKDSDEDGETEGDPKQQAKFKPSYILIALDTDPSLFVKYESDGSPFIDCLNACYEVMESLVLSDRGSAKGPAAIVMAENEATRANFIDFQNPVPDTVKLLKNLKNQTNDELKSKYQRKTDLDLASFFLFCKNKLTEINAEVYKRIVLYITNDDDPVKNEPRKRFQVINEAQKFANMQIDLKVITFKKDFDSKAFYSEILDAAKSPPIELVDSLNLTDRISTQVKKRSVTLKTKFYPFQKDSERYFEVVIHKVETSSNIPKNMYVTRDTQQEVKKAIKKKETTGNYLVEYSKNQPPLKVTEREKECITETDIPVGYSLMYVGESELQRGWVIEAPTLMEKSFKVTQPIFEAFWEFCRTKSRCLFCLRKFRKCGKVRVVQLEPNYINNTRMFLVKVLPHRGEIFSKPQDSPKISFSELEEKAITDLVNTMTFDFNVANFIDPVYAKRKAYIKSQILEEPIEEPPNTVPTDTAIDKLIADQVQSLHKLNLVENTEDAGAKRKAPVKKEGVQRKKRGAKN